MYHASDIEYIEPHKSFGAIIQSGQFLVHTYSNSYLPSLTTSYINSHSGAALVDDFYVYTIILVLIWAYLHDNAIF